MFSLLSVIPRQDPHTSKFEISTQPFQVFRIKPDQRTKSFNGSMRYYF